LKNSLAQDYFFQPGLEIFERAGIAEEAQSEL
jgi:hypothetical protein